MQALHKTYEVRSGTKDSGREYEFKMVALLSVRCIVEGVEEMWIISNADGVDAFDDIVLNIRTAAGDNITFMIQLKHQDKPRNVTEAQFLSPKGGDFSLSKYFNQKLKQSIKSTTLDIVKDLGAFDTIYFALFTNRGVYSYDILDKTIHAMSSLLNTANGDVHKFNLSKLPPEYVHLSNASATCSKFFFYSNQIGVKHLDDQIATVIKNHFQSLGITQINAKIIAKDFIDYVTNWAKGNFGEHYYLTKQEVLCKLSELLLRQFEINLNDQRFTSYDCPQKLLWNEIIKNENLILIDLENNDDVIYQFVFEYIGSEVKKFCKEPLKNWSDNLSKQYKNSFYQQIDEKFKKQMLKVVGKQREITPLDIYRCMYMINKLPYLLKVRKVQDYQNILHILKFSNSHFKIIIANKCEKMLTIPNTLKSFRVLQDLRQEDRNKILQLPVKLQGRKSVLLGTLVDDEICKHIKCRDIIDILLNNYNIGNEIKAAPEYFIERSFSKILLWPRILQTNNDDIFLIEATVKKHLNRLPIRNQKVFKWEDIDFERLNGSIIVSGLENANSKQMKKLKSARRKIHYFTIYNTHCLEWKWSLNSIKNLLPYRINNDEVFENDMQQKFSNSINIISAPPGMGKTFLMESIARQAPTNKWLLKIDLNTNDGREHYTNVRKQPNTKSGAHLRHFNYHLLNKISCNTRLVQMVFEKLLKAKNIIVLLDGFDEVSFSFRDEVTDIAKSLYRDGYQMWLTTRPHMTSYLEKQLNTFSFTLKPFDMDDQKFFLTKYFGTLNPGLSCSCRLLNQFINKLLQAARNNLNDSDAEFTGIPLQTKLLAEVFNDDCRKYLCNNGKSKFKENFDLLSLYQILIENKIDILCEKFGPVTEADMRIIFKDHQSLFACKLLFPLKCLEGSYVKKILEDSYKNKQSKLELLQRDGIIMVDENLNVSCVHQTFAEYLLAQWMSENLSNKNENIADLVRYLLQSRFLGWHNFLYNVFDRIVGENCSLPLLKSLHLAFTNREITKVKRILNENPNIVSEVDNCGRSILHMIVLYAVQFPLRYDLNYVTGRTFNSDGMLEIIKTISDDQIKMIGDDILGCSLLDYAISNCALTTANAICEKSDISTIKYLIFNSHNRHEYLEYCAVLNYKRLFKILLSFFISGDVLLRRENGNLHIFVKNYVHNDLIRRYNEGINFKERISGEMTLLELLQSNIGNSYSGYSNNNYSNLSFAIALGTEKNVDSILRHDINVNKRDFNLCTPLHYASFFGKPKIVAALLSKGANTDIQGSDHNAALHFAILGYILSVTHTSINPQGSRDDYYNIIVQLVKGGANINIQNGYGVTPLHCILCMSCATDYFIINNLNQGTKTQLLEIVRLLISKGADVNMRTLEGYTSLHIAAGDILEECVTELLNNGADGNIITNEGLSPFHSLIHSEWVIITDKIKTLMISNVNRDYTWIYDKKERIVKELVARGTNINKNDNAGETPLHLAMMGCCISHCRVVKVILEEGADVNIQNYSGNTPLHMALIDSKLEILYQENLIELLLNKNVDVNLQNYDGNTPLHLMAETFKFSIPHFKVLVSLLNKGANTNVKNLNRKSVLELAYDIGNMEMICILYYFIVRKLLRLYPNLVLQI